MNGWGVYEGAKRPETEELRDRIKLGLEQQALDFFQKEGGQVVIYDANNGVRKTRYELWKRFNEAGVKVIFLGTPTLLLLLSFLIWVGWADLGLGLHSY